MQEPVPTPTSVTCTDAGVTAIFASHLAIPVWPAADPGADDAVPAEADGADTAADAPGDPGGHPGDGATGTGGADLVLGRGAAELVEGLDVDLFGALDREEATGQAGQVTVVPLGAAGRGAGGPDGDTDLEVVYLVGLGDGSPTAHRRAGAALARAVRGLPSVASTVTSTSDDAGVQAFVEALVLATFRWRASATSLPVRQRPVAEVVLVETGAAGQAAAERGRAVAGATWLGRTLVHTPSNTKDPGWLAEQAESVAEGPRVRCTVRDERALAKDGFGGILAVGQGSARPPRLIELAYTPAAGDGADVPHVVLVGKGITFDSGGLSLKPAQGMVPMKTDMSGGAVVIGVLSALAALEVPVRVTGLVAAAENMPGGGAQRPGDVITQYGGTTVEVLNTDAEGRLVLADAMAYAAARLNPTVVVDVATLTGAATMGLGRRHAAMFTNDDGLAEALRAAGAAAGEQLWRLPLVEEYRSALDSDVADVAHVPTRSVGGGAITAALFLERFAGSVPWAHLDIAGPGRADADEHEVTKGGTAFGARALLYWLGAGAPGVTPGSTAPTG